MIYYDIQHFGDPAPLDFLLTTLQGSNVTVRISYDATAEFVENYRAGLSQVDLNFRHVIIEQSAPVTWCGPSMITTFCGALRRALEVPDWEFFTNLSGVCVALGTQPEFLNRLVHLRNQGKTAHISSFKVKTPVILAPEKGDFSTLRQKRNRLELQGAQNLLETFWDEHFFPVRNPQNRVFLRCQESTVQPKVLEIARPSDDELSIIRDYFDKHQHYCGRAWYSLHRSVCEELVAFLDSPKSDMTRYVFENCFLPDESFMQTIVFNGLAFSPDKISNLNFRYKHGAPGPVDDSLVETIFALEDTFFARKHVWNDSAALRAAITARLRQA